MADNNYCEKGFGDYTSKKQSVFYGSNRIVFRVLLFVI